MKRLTAPLLALLPAAWVLAWLHLPLAEDALFWWVPRGLWLAERGPAWIAAGELPAACRPDLPLPPQWSGGLPDFGHPPAWFLYLATWLRLLGPRVEAVRLGLLPVALLLGAGWSLLARRLAGSALAALPLLLSPPLLAQLLRPDTDLGLLALLPWALLALLERRAAAFAALSALATAVKEPGVLLAAPALLLGMRERRFLLAALAAPATLGAWAWLHARLAGWALAGPEVLASPTQLPANLLAVLRLLLLGPGAWLLAALLLLLALRPFLRRRGLPLPAAPPAALLAYLLVQLAFFSAVDFLGGRAVAQAYTHVRYLLPAHALALLLLAAALLQLLPPRAGRALLLLAAALGLLGSTRLHPRGPEANLFGLALARSWQRAARELPGMRERLQGELWVESYLYTALTRPYAGLVDAPLEGLRPYGPETEPSWVLPGDGLLRAAYGEPLGRLGELRLAPLARWGSEAWVELDRVEPGRAAAPAR